MALFLNINKYKYKVKASFLMFEENPQDSLMDLRTFLIIAVISSLIIGLVESSSQPKSIETSKIGAGSVILDKSGQYFVEYNLTKMRFLIPLKTKIVFPVDKSALPALEFLYTQTKLSNKTLPSNPAADSECVLAWWKNGHPIQAITRMRALFFSPEPSFLFFSKTNKWDASKQGDFSNRNQFLEFSKILYNGTISELKTFAIENNCSWIAVFSQDLYDLPELYWYLNKNLPSPKEREKVISDAAFNSLIYKIFSSDPLDFSCNKSGLELAFADANSRIFKVC